MSLISIIIPIINEEKSLLNLLPTLPNKSSIEIIFVDGGSQDNSINLIKQYGFQVISSPQLRRSYQMNLGANSAQGEIFLFLHGDTLLPSNFDDLILQTIHQNNFIMGAFYLKINSNKFIFRILETLVNYRSTYFSLPYGDQGIFLTKKVFKEIKGYKDMAIMEDFELVNRLKKLGKIYVIKSPVLTSARRWEKLGVFKTTLINQLIIIGYYLKIDLKKLASFYRQIRCKYRD